MRSLTNVSFFRTKLESPRFSVGEILVLKESRSVSRDTDKLFSECLLWCSTSGTDHFVNS